MKRCVMFICVFISALAFVSCSKDDPPRSIVGTVVKKYKPDPYTYRLEIRVELADHTGEKLKGETLKEGEQITVVPNYIYVAPSLLDMTKATNHSLMELAKMNPGERLNATVALSHQGSWVLIDGKKL